MTKAKEKNEAKLLSKACRAYFRELQRSNKQMKKGEITSAERLTAHAEARVRYVRYACGSPKLRSR